VTAERAADTVTVSRVLEELVRTLSDRGLAEPVTEAREILAALLDVPRFWPIVNAGVELDTAMHERARVAVRAGLAGRRSPTPSAGRASDISRSTSTNAY
jgi:hypothetical protein